MKRPPKKVLLLFATTILITYFTIVPLFTGGLWHICTWRRPAEPVDLHSICFDAAGNNASDQDNSYYGHCLPPLLPFDSKFRLVERFKLLACVIEKNMFALPYQLIFAQCPIIFMSTIFAALMCYLRDPQAFLAANRTLTGEAYQHRFCKGQNEFGTVKAILNGTGTRERDWHFLALVRDPLERFLSGYIDKCIKSEANMTSPFRRIVCYNCSSDLACFVRRQFRRAQIFASNGGRSRLYWTYEDFHFFPQNWYCQFHSHFAHFKLFHFGEKQEERVKMQSELIEWLRHEGNVPEELLLGIRERLVHQTGHSTREDPQREGIKRKLLGDRELRRKLARMFYMDYALFGLPFGELFV